MGTRLGGQRAIPFRNSWFGGTAAEHPGLTSPVRDLAIHLTGYWHGLVRCTWDVPRGPTDPVGLVQTVHAAGAADTDRSRGVQLPAPDGGNRTYIV